MNEQKSGGSVLAFVGSTPNIGTTIASFATAVSLARKLQGSVAYICLNLKSSKLHRYLGRETPEITLNHLRAELKSQTLKRERLQFYCEPLKDAANLHVLYGNMRREQADFYTAEEIGHLLRSARETFDITVIEVNAYWDNAATVCGLMEADKRIVVTTHQLCHFQEDFNQWIGQVGSVVGLEAAQFSCVITQSVNSVLKVKDIAKETDTSVLGQIRHHSQAADYLNQGKLLELLCCPHLQEDVEPIAAQIIKEFDWNCRPAVTTKPWIRRVMAAVSQ